MNPYSIATPSSLNCDTNVRRNEVSLGDLASISVYKLVTAAERVLNRLTAR